MLVKITRVFILLSLSISNFSLPAQKENIYFGKGVFNLDASSRAKLIVFLVRLQKTSEGTITITGYADSSGNTQKNLALSKKRAESVSNYFIQNGISKERITLQFYGESKALAGKQDDQENRKVTVTMGKGNSPMVVTSSLPKLNKTSSLVRWKAVTLENASCGIGGAEGTYIAFLKNSFCRSNGEPVTGDIAIELFEYYKRSDILYSGLCTLSDDQALESGGIIYVVATSGGETLRLKEGIFIEISFAGVQKDDKDFTIFNGEQRGKQVKWKQYPGELSTNGNRLNNEVFTEPVHNANNKNRLVLRTNSLGWISCARIKDIATKTDLLVSIRPVDKAIVRLLFKDMNVILPATKTGNGTYIINNIPVGQKATLVAFSLAHDAAYLMSKELVISEYGKEDLELAKITEAGLAVKLKKLDLPKK